MLEIDILDLPENWQLAITKNLPEKMLLFFKTEKKQKNWKKL
jgi:hypothetical protein